MDNRRHRIRKKDSTPFVLVFLVVFRIGNWENDWENENQSENPERETNPTNLHEKERSVSLDPIRGNSWNLCHLAGEIQVQSHAMSTAAALTATPEPPYYAVIFTSLRTDGDRGYGAMAGRMVQLAAQQPGYLGVDSVRDAAGRGITISYWRDAASIAAWKRDTEHQQAQRGGQQTWYADYQVRIAKVERAYGKPGTE